MSHTAFMVIDALLLIVVIAFVVAALTDRE